MLTLEASDLTSCLVDIHVEVVEAQNWGKRLGDNQELHLLEAAFQVEAPEARYNLAVHCNY